MFDVNDDQFSVPAPLALLEEMVVTRLTGDAEGGEIFRKRSGGNGERAKGEKVNEIYT